MSDSCGCEGAVFTGMTPAYRRALWAVILINGLMFAVEVSAGLAAMSQALKADALDFLGDTITYAMSLWALGWSARARARVALVKGLSLGAMGVVVLGTTVWRIFVVGAPQAEIMGIVGVMALAANVASVLLLMRYREGDANVRSVWLCSRNDAIGNAAVIVAAGAVAATGSAWPDLVVAAVMAGLFVRSSIGIIGRARGELVAI